MFSLRSFFLMLMKLVSFQSLIPYRNIFLYTYFIICSVKNLFIKHRLIVYPSSPNRNTEIGLSNKTTTVVCNNTNNEKEIADKMLIEHLKAENDQLNKIKQELEKKLKVAIQELQATSHKMNAYEQLTSTAKKQSLEIQGLYTKCQMYHDLFKKLKNNNKELLCRPVIINKTRLTPTATHPMYKKGSKSRRTVKMISDKKDDNNNRYCAELILTTHHPSCTNIALTNIAKRNVLNNPKFIGRLQKGFIKYKQIRNQPFFLLNKFNTNVRQQLQQLFIDNSTRKNIHSMWGLFWCWIKISIIMLIILISTVKKACKAR
ncbi:uncharacterized protein BX663DRAFT_518838 [Cokeromyces recurvatus]|uniref:uncharacterized protein n=1 Tax=Cokeromyces recurvatus TaxID=90255 RepID=UPI00222034FB|nr:uncharacterized protein BX663DRAFT_522334 [Cokeromyces recurvatus]XP_051380156.1 uncharacterized protein BX663DRAFT_518838 [Cokeromyces recurvatus]KAI7899113.1 hypothetical protein BX663DRAFT_522334 [Cokeromyces recurvatus]KAI7900171.1 hypothetical protein BX663DRAFT_518838 [Cokeromyces recurvatus]